MIDAIAVAWFLVLAIAYEVISQHPRFLPHNIAGGMQQQRKAWMREMAGRDVRIVDAQLMASLSQANAFFASTSALAVGGLATLLGSDEKVRSVIGQIPYAAQPSAFLVELKILCLMAILVYAFFKFAWAYRLSHFTVILLGATPSHDAPDSDARIRHADRVSQLLGLAAEHANSGLRALYYVIAALSWFFHPAAFMIAMLAVISLLARRDFFSRSRRIIAGIPVE